MTRPERGRSLRTPKQAALACISAIHCRDISSRCMIFSDAASLPIDRSRADARNRPIPDDNSASLRLDDFPFRTNASVAVAPGRPSSSRAIQTGAGGRGGSRRIACLSRVSRVFRDRRALKPRRGCAATSSSIMIARILRSIVKFRVIKRVRARPARFCEYNRNNNPARCPALYTATMVRFLSFRLVVT